MKPLTLLQRYATQREKAYRAHGYLNTKRARAISRIKQLCGYWKQLPTEKQRNIARQLKTEVLAILPETDSRFRKQREQILNLIE